MIAFVLWPTVKFANWHRKRKSLGNFGHLAQPVSRNYLILETSKPIDNGEYKKTDWCFKQRNITVAKKKKKKKKALSVRTTSALLLQPISFQSSGRVGGTVSIANMAASLDDDLQFNNRGDYYSLLNVRKEVWFIVFLSAVKWWRTFRCACLVDFLWGICPQLVHHLSVG